MAKHRVVAIDIGTNAAKMVEFEQTSAAVHLVNASVVAYPDTADRQQRAESVERLWATLGNPPTKGTLRAFFNRHKTEVSIALPRFLVSTKRLTNLPAATDEQLANLVAIAAETELPFRTEDAIFTYHDVQRTSGTTSVELVSTRRDTVTGYLDMLKQIGVSASAVTPSMIAIAEVAARSALPRCPTFIVDIGAGHTDFCFVENGALRFSRSFRLGGSHLSEHVSAALNVDRDTAEQEKRHLSAREAPTREWTTRFIGELQRSIAAALREKVTETPAYSPEEDANGYQNTEARGQNAPAAETERELWLCGGTARVRELAAVCEEELNITTHLWNPLHAIGQHAGIDIRPENAAVDNTLDEWGDTLAVPLGVGLHALNPAERVSLLPKEAAETLTQTTRQRRLLFTSGVAGLMIGGLAFGGYTLSRIQQHKTEAVESQLAAYAQPVEAAKAQLGRELVLTEMLSHHISPLDILHALSEMFRDRTQVAWTNFNISNLNEPDKARITFNLESDSHHAINSLLRALGRSGVFKKVQTGEVTTMSRNRKQIFQVQVRCNLTPSAVQAFAKKRFTNDTQAKD